MQSGVLQSSGDPTASLLVARTDCEGKPVGNRILLALPDTEYQILRPFLTLVDPRPHAVLHEPGDKLEFVHFPNRGLVSLIVVTREAKTVAVGVIGNEGLIGVPAVMGLNRDLHTAADKHPHQRKSRTRSRAVSGAPKREPRASASRRALARQAKESSARRGKRVRSAAALKAARTRKAA